MMSESVTHELWRVSLEDGTSRDVPVFLESQGWTTGVEGYSATARAAVIRASSSCGWSVVEILAPGDPSGDDERTRARFATWLHDRADDVANDDPVAAETLYLAERDYRRASPRPVRHAGEKLDVDKVETMAREAFGGRWIVQQPRGFGAQQVLVTDDPKQAWSCVIGLLFCDHPTSAFIENSREDVLSLCRALRAAHDDNAEMLSAIREIYAAVAPERANITTDLFSPRPEEAPVDFARLVASEVRGYAARGAAQVVEAWCACVACDGKPSDPPCDACGGDGRVPASIEAARLTRNDSAPNGDTETAR
jgi:hypothetical protein